MIHHAVGELAAMLTALQSDADLGLLASVADRVSRRNVRRLPRPCRYIFEEWPKERSRSNRRRCIRRHREARLPQEHDRREGQANRPIDFSAFLARTAFSNQSKTRACRGARSNESHTRPMGRVRNRKMCAQQSSSPGSLLSPISMCNYKLGVVRVHRYVSKSSEKFSS